MIELGADPHAVLGAHEANGGVVVRAFRPEAQAVRVQPGAVEAKLKDPAGLWEAMLPKAKLPLEYEIEVEYPNGDTFTQRDPYAFLPTLGELDLHLVMEGRHEQLYEKLGAHVRELDGVTGTAFAVWAPNARSVSVVGDFNSWDGRLHPMRSLGASGIWELFLPGVESGAQYKFEIRTQDGRLRLKADPVAFYSEVPPANASRVFRSEHEWSDDDWLEQRAATEPLRRPGVDLRGPPRLVAAQPGRGQPPAHVPGARRRARRLRLRPRLHARRAAAGDGAPVLRLVGLPGHRLLRADVALRHAGRLPHVRRAHARARHRRDPRLGARALPARRLGARALRRHAPVRARRPAARRASRTGARSSSTSAAAR